MADGTVLNPGTGGDTIATEQPGGVGVKIPVTKIRVGALDVDGGDVTATNPFDVRIGDATNTASVKAASIAAATTDKALVVAISPNNTVPVSGAFFQTTQPVSVAATLPVSLAAAVDVSDRAARLVGHVTIDNVSLPVTGTFFQGTQPVSAAALPLPAGASTEATLALIKAKTDNLDVALSTRAVTGITDVQIRATALPVVLAAGANTIGATTSAVDPFGVAQSLAVSLRNGALELLVADRAQRDGLDAANLTLADIRDAVQGLPTATAAAAPPAVQAVSGSVTVAGLVSAQVQGINDQGQPQTFGFSTRNNLSTQSVFDPDGARQRDDIILLLTDIRDALWRGLGQ